MAVTAWNAVVFDQVLADQSQLDDIRTRLKDDPTLPMIEHLIQRKLERFSDHRFAISEWDITTGAEGQLLLKVEGRDLETPKTGD